MDQLKEQALNDFECFRRILQRRRSMYREVAPVVVFEASDLAERTRGIDLDDEFSSRAIN